MIYKTLSFLLIVKVHIVTHLKQQKLFCCFGVSFCRHVWWSVSAGVQVCRCSRGTRRHDSSDAWSHLWASHCHAHSCSTWDDACLLSVAGLSVCLPSSPVHLSPNTDSEFVLDIKVWGQLIHFVHCWQTKYNKWTMLPYVYSYKASCARPVYAVICNFWHLGTLTLRAERQSLSSSECQSAWMSKITNDGLTRSGTGCFIVIIMPIRVPYVNSGCLGFDSSL